MRTRHGSFILTAVFAALMLVPVRAAAPAASIPFQSASVDSADNQTFTLDWNAPHIVRIEVMASTNANAFDGKPRAEGGSHGHVTLTLPSAPRWYFKLVPDRGAPLIVADRSVHLSSVANFRDVGGYRTRDGHWVRMGVAYRSNALNVMTAQDLTRAETLGLKMVCDLRMDDERMRSPDPTITKATEISDNVLADKQAEFRASAAAKSKPVSASPATDATKKVKQAYRDFVDLNSARAAYHDLFERLSNPASLPTVFHCTAGKDRTGWAQAVLLTILGVPRDVILKDYQLTDRYLAPQAATVAKTLAPGTEAAAMQRILKADPAYLQAAFDEVHKRYGSFDGYLDKGLNLDGRTLSAIRKNFLTP